MPRGHLPPLPSSPHTQNTLTQTYKHITPPSFSHFTHINTYTHIYISMPPTHTHPYHILCSHNIKQNILSAPASVEKVNCSGEENWVFVENGTFRISGSAIERFGKITCEYAPIVRGRGDYSARHAEHIKPMLDGSPLVSDFFKVIQNLSSTNKYIPSYQLSITILSFTLYAFHNNLYS